MKVMLVVDSRDCFEPFLEFIAKHRFDAQASFKVVHVIEPLLVGSYMSVLPSPLLQSVQQELFTSGKELVADLSAALKDKVPGAAVEAEIKLGYTVHEIVEAAKEFAAELLVVGTHNRHGFDRFVMGSVSGELAAKVHCTVVVLKLLGQERSETQAAISTANEKVGAN